MVKDLTAMQLRLLFVYHNVLKSPDAFILKKMANEYRDRFEGFIDFAPIDLNSPQALLLLVLSRTVKNPIEWLATEKFDYDKIYDQLVKGFPNAYRDSERLRMYESVYNLSRSYCVEKIFIWNEVDDVRQRFDLDELLHNDKVEYVVNKDLYQALKDIGDINFVYDWDIDRLYRIMNSKEFDNTFFGIAGYPFNFDKDKPYALKYNMSEKPNIAYYYVHNINETNKYFG